MYSAGRQHIPVPDPVVIPPKLRERLGSSPFVFMENHGNKGARAAQLPKTYLKHGKLTFSKPNLHMSSLQCFQFPVSTLKEASKVQTSKSYSDPSGNDRPMPFEVWSGYVTSNVLIQPLFSITSSNSGTKFHGDDLFFFFFKCWHEIFETFVPSEVLFQKTETKNRSQDQTHHVLETRKESRSFEVEGIHHEQLLISNLICYSFEMAWHAFTLKEIAMINSVPLSKKKKKELTLYSCKRFEKLSTYHMVP